jgi:hypothetical protein
MRIRLIIAALNLTLSTQKIYSSNESEVGYFAYVTNCIGGKCYKVGKWISDTHESYVRGRVAQELLPKVEKQLEDSEKARKKTEDEYHQAQASLQKQQAENSNSENGSAYTVTKALERTKLEQASQLAAIGTATVVVSGAVYRAGDKIYHHFNPTKEQLLRDEYISQQLERLRAERAIRKCLAYNDEAEKDAEGMPRICSKELKAFIAIATPQEVQETKDAFRNR